MTTIKMCTVRPIPANLEAAARLTALNENPRNGTVLEVAGLTKYFWRPGRRLRVRFLDGDPVVQAKVVAVAQEWTNFANITFDFGNDPDAEIRISFTPDGSWSYIGTVALNIPQAEPTMNFGWLTPTTPDEEYSRVVLHEFGHALGLIHEHQHPANPIPWDVNAVYAFYMGPPNNWTKDEVDINVLGRYSAEVTQHTAFDPHSIMLYPVDNALTVGDWEIPWRNTVLSDLDKQFIAGVYSHARLFDAGAVAPNGKLYFFRQNRYTRLSLPGRTLDPGYPKPIAGNWAGMPADFADGVDAVATIDGKLYFFRGAHCVRYTMGSGVDAGYPKAISDEFPEAVF